ncbi:Uma2 family endonuclease [Rhodoplanes sp. TEM]|uniref:Uma2 family endonuclease n=1 Tax=Rhodoplanes tepidamans TaxID=200616 RepID=A0ABT5JDJ2_RHOTP|nr:MULTISPECIES: Uma2 family endonuclease [Rhodoplanes]MDC7787749.1 Uma2 family endonuclease [Rhodoplanes tepidamans]MDC7982688.1 Uma2 family endonuclease [Rhodoplanes sp. TEM]MDQ0357665.1 Uma2 family endonuclease [Rhodoplanes tepidamans]
MTIRTLPPLTPEEFLRHPDLQGERCELSEGRVVLMTGASKAHREVAGRLFFQLFGALDEGRYHVTMSELAVRVGGSVRYPDVVVDQQSDDPKGLTAVGPLLIAEVLSPSTMLVDSGKKLTEYTSLPSLLYYLVLSQDEPVAWLYRRDEAGAFPAEPQRLLGREAEIILLAFDLAIPLGALYREAKS